MYKYDSQYISDYSTGRKFLKMDSQYVSDYSTGKKLLKWDGMKLKDYSTGKLVGDFTGWNRTVAALMALGYF